MNWTKVCQDFNSRDLTTNSWAEGPTDINKYIAIANDLIKPATIQSNTLRTVARKRASTDKEINKHNKISSSRH